MYRIYRNEKGTRIYLPDHSADYREAKWLQLTANRTSEYTWFLQYPNEKVEMSDEKIKIKFEGMSEPEEFSVTPFGDGPNERILQSDHRLAKVDLVEKTIVLSKALPEKPGFIRLLEQFGAVESACPVEIIEELEKIKVRDFSLVD